MRRFYRSKEQDLQNKITMHNMQNLGDSDTERSSEIEKLLDKQVKRNIN